MDKLIDFHNSKEQTGNNAVLYQASIIKNSILRNNQPLKSTMNEGNKNNLENDGEIQVQNTDELLIKDNEPLVDKHKTSINKIN